MKLYRFLSIGALCVATTLASAQAVPAKAPASNAPAAAKPVTKAAGATSGSSAPIDINTASPDQLKQLPGIGDAYSKRIVDGRPYAAKTQLVSRGILPKATYDGISGQIIAKHVGK